MIKLDLTSTQAQATLEAIDAFRRRNSRRRGVTPLTKDEVPELLKAGANWDVMVAAR